MAYNKNNNRRNNQRNNPKPWTEISGEMMVFGNERKTRKGKPFISYAATVGRKDRDGKWNNMYFNVGFPKGEDPEIVGGFKITVKSGFLSFDSYTDKSGQEHRTPRVVVTAFEFAEDPEDD